MKKILLILIASLAHYSYGQNSFWTENGAATSGRIAGQPNASQRYYNLDLQGLKKAVLQAPAARTNSKIPEVIVGFPTASGQIKRFLVSEASVLPAELREKYPGIYSFAGRDVDDPATTIRFSLSDYNGVQAIILGAAKATFIEPIQPGNMHNYKVYSDLESTFKFNCKTSDLGKEVEAEIKPSSKKSDANARATGPNLRVFRAAIFIPPSYGDEYAGTGTDQQKRANILAQVNGVVTQLNAIFERDLSVRIQLVPNNDKIVFYTGLPDPGGSTTQDVINNLIGFSNYDIGHTFLRNTDDGQDNAGDAGCIGCICTKDKGLAWTLGRYTSSAVFVYIVAHEMGHQMGAYHVQTCESRISGNGKSEVEPGSGSTIMGYAGICSPEVEYAPDGYYNQISIRQIDSYIGTLSCGSSVSTGNSAPTVNAGLDYTIPKSTPFVLTGQASDPDAGDGLTYTWEQNDPQIYNYNNFEDGRNLDRGLPPTFKTTGPMFRSYPPSSSPVRILPDLETVRNDGPYIFEVLPSVARTLNFVLTARDNHPGGGRVQFDSMKVFIANNAGPFDFSSTTPYVWTAGSTQSVLWNVAGTNTAPVNCQNVKISLSIDGGKTFAYVLAASTANDGSENIVVPVNISSENCRLKIEAINNIFYALSNTDFSITAGGCVTTAPDSIFVQRIAAPTATLGWFRGNNTKYEIRYRRKGTTTWTTQAVSDKPGMYIVTETINSLSAGNTYEAQVRSLCDGSNTLTVRARGVTGQEHINLKVNNVIIGSVTLTTAYQNYTYQTTQTGPILVQYDNDQGSRDVQVDYVEVNGEIRQAEAQSFNTAVSVNGQCGNGSFSEWMHCNGSIGFDNINRNNITIRARGTLGGEHINLRINNAVVANYTLTTAFQNYTATFNTTGGITVEFDNDKANSDVVVDYILVNGLIRQAEDQSYNTAAFINNQCGGGGFTEWMHCNGLIGFGNADLPGSGGSAWSKLITFTMFPTEYHPDDVNTLLAIDQFNNREDYAGTTWMGTPNPGNWSGVVWTTVAPRRVRTLTMYYQGLTGKVYLGALPSLDTLVIAGNKITQLDLTGSTALKQLRCDDNLLTSLDLSTLTNLLDLDCYRNTLQQLNLGTINKLQRADISINHLQSVNVSNLVNIKELSVSSNYLATLDPSKCINLEEFNCSNNNLTSLNLLPLTKLKTASCALNQLTTLNVTGMHITELNCNSNNLTAITGLASIPVTDLRAQVNKMTSINLRDNAELQNVSVSYNQSTSITLPSPSALGLLFVDNNNLTQLDVSGQTGIRLYCGYNKLTRFITSAPTNVSAVEAPFNNLPFSELAKFDVSDYLYYGPQNEIFTPVTSSTNVTINYSSQVVIAGITTTFRWYKNDQLVATNTTGKFTTTGIGIYYCKMVNAYFPELELTTAKTTIIAPGTRMMESEIARDEAPAVPIVMAIYPNPATQAIVVQLPDAAPSHIALYTPVGTQVFEKSGVASQTTLDVSDARPGLYILKVTTGGHTYEKRVVIQH